jgi:hypothetical protein
MEETLAEVRILIRENILPRLDNLDAEVTDLRDVTWPVCQGQRDTAAGGPFANLNAKSYFLKFLHLDDIRRLLRRKAIVMGICPSVAEEELRQIKVCR